MTQAGERIVIDRNTWTHDGCGYDAGGLELHCSGCGKKVCMKCGRPFADVNDFRAIRDNEHVLDGLCPTGYAIRDPDAAADCEAHALKFAQPPAEAGERCQRCGVRY